MKYSKRQLSILKRALAGEHAVSRPYGVTSARALERLGLGRLSLTEYRGYFRANARGLAEAVRLFPELAKGGEEKR